MLKDVQIGRCADKLNIYWFDDWKIENMIS